MSDTIAAVSTGTQVCAIGIVRMSGGKAIEIADRLFWMTRELSSPRKPSPPRGRC